jgi:hypothetical protein
MPSPIFMRALINKLQRERRLRSARRQTAYFRLCAADTGTRAAMSCPCVDRIGDNDNARHSKGNITRVTLQVSASAAAKLTADRYAEFSQSWAKEIAATRDSVCHVERFRNHRPHQLV